MKKATTAFQRSDEPTINSVYEFASEIISNVFMFMSTKETCQMTFKKSTQRWKTTY